MKYVYPLIATHESGYTILLYNKDEVLSFTRKYGQFDDHRYNYVYNFTLTPSLTKIITNPWLVRDDLGYIVNYQKFMAENSTPLWYRYNKRRAEIRKIAEKGLPIPGTGTSRPYCTNHAQKKNSGRGHRNRNRALAIYEAKEYNVKNKVGFRIIPCE